MIDLSKRETQVKSFVPQTNIDRVLEQVRR
jgi:hypothetical protein